MRPTGPDPMDHHERMKLRSAAFHATRVYPGPVGELVSRELLSWEDFGYRLGGSHLIMELVDFVMKQQAQAPPPYLSKEEKSIPA